MATLYHHFPSLFTLHIVASLYHHLLCSYNCCHNHVPYLVLPKEVFNLLFPYLTLQYASCCFHLADAATFHYTGDGTPYRQRATMCGLFHGRWRGRLPLLATGHQTGNGPPDRQRATMCGLSHGRSRGRLPLLVTGHQTGNGSPNRETDTEFVISGLENPM